MKKEHSFLTILICSLLIVIFSLISCLEPANLLRQEAVPDGMGAVSLVLGGQNSRTIMPQTPVFQVYELAFTGDNVNVIIDRCIDTFSDPIHLPIGTFNLLVTAYVDTEKNEPAAWGEESNIRINAGQGVTHTISLRPFSPDGGELGTFSWDISFPSEVTQARLNISPLSENGEIDKEFYFEGAGGETPLSGSVSLKSGFYSVLFTLVKPGYQTLEWLEILHIFQNIVSSYTQDFNIELFNNIVYTVVFVFDDGSTVEQSYFHGDLVLPFHPQPQSARNGYTFGGWYTNANFSERWDFSTPLSRNRTFYLRWLSETCSDANIIGTFQGAITLHGFINAGEAIVQLFDDNTARIQLASIPNYTILANFSYHSVRRDLRLSNINLHASGMGRQAMESLIGDVPSQITLPIRQWTLDEVITIDTPVIAGNLYRVDRFNFSPNISFTEITLHIEYPDSSRHGKYVLTEVQFLDIGMPPITLIGTLQGNRKTRTAVFPNNSMQDSSTRISVTSYLFDSIGDLNTVVGFAASQPALLMAGARFSETTNNSWQPQAIFTVLNGVENQEFAVRFPERLNIRMDHRNFTNNNPVVSWDPFPGANGYFVLVTVRDTLSNVEANRHNIVTAFYQHTMETSVTIHSHRISFTPIDTFFSIIPPTITPGDFIRIEVFALDHSGFLDSVNRTGALFMDSLTIIR
ncbi:MAG: InlB B-repeat-containing protein [Treponema sp.]|nr:InlB B-repeat-containing protein [Treponema sp.]